MQGPIIFFAVFAFIVLVTILKTAIIVPQKYEIGHEAHFSQVMNMYLGWMKKGEQPADYLPNMLVKYHTLAEAWKASRR